MKAKNKKIILVFLLILFISIGYAYLTSNLDIMGITTVKNNKWDLHFENVVDDKKGATIDIPANISQNKLSVNYQVTLNLPGDEYYFYVDVVNAGTIDVMLSEYLITGLSDEQKEYITSTVTYNDGVELKKNDLIEKDSYDTLKVYVKYRDDITINDLPEEDSEFTLNFTATFVQADSSAKLRLRTEDSTGPSIRFKTLNQNSGNDKWDKDIMLSIKLMDPNGVDNAKYCITSEEECVPDTKAELTNNEFIYSFQEADYIQRICVSASDKKGNETVKCSEESYFIDGVDPLISNVALTKDGNNITVNIEASDALSGVVKYYFSKDSGKTYVESKNPNYTFTVLEDDDYLITTYVEDGAGNTSAVDAKTDIIRTNNWCKNNGITKLGDCLLTSEARTANLSQAKVKINNKAPVVINNASPATSYEETESAKASMVEITDTSSYYKNTGSLYSSSYTYMGTGYTFNKDTGYFSITGGSYTYARENTFDFENNTYYICANSYGSSSCKKLYKIVSGNRLSSESTNSENITSIKNKYSFLKYDLDPKVVGYISDDSGIHAAEDNQGTSYYYRGVVSGNIVKFGNAYWKVIRINGDGTIRMIHYGSTIDQVTYYGGSKVFNTLAYDPTYVGIKNNKSGFNTEIQESTEKSTGYNSLASYSKVYYSKNYNYNQETGLFSLDQTEGNIINGAWADIHDQVLNERYLYTCASSNISSTCQRIQKITGYTAPTETNLIHSKKYVYMNYVSTSYENAIKNIDESNALKELNTWYEGNIKDQQDSNGNLLSTYLADNIFCNDRELHTGDGFDAFNKTTYYKSYSRVNTKSPSLICTLDNDKFTVSKSNGNGALSNPIGLITSDEALLAGTYIGNYTNKLFYLSYGTRSFYTMSPRNYSYSNGAGIYIIASDGSLSNTYVHNSSMLRPVINLKANTKIVSGNGTPDSPFEITLG